MRTIQFALTLVAICFFASSAMAQKEETILGSRGLRLSGIWGGPKSQITKFGNSNSFVNGGVFGLEFGNALCLGYGRYSLGTDVKWDNITNQNFEYNWGGPVIAYGINNFKRVHPVVSIQAGPGNAKFADINDKIFVIQPSAGVELNVFRWLHIGLDGGYRFTGDSDLSGLTDSQLSGAFGQLSFRFGYSWTNLRNTKRGNKSKTQSEKM